MTNFYPRIAREGSGYTGDAFPALLYIATPENEHWIGEESLETLALMISESEGPSGHNVEYLVRLAMFMRDELPGAQDDHLFELERLVVQYLSTKGIMMSSCMGAPRQRIRRDSHENNINSRPINFEHTSRVPTRKMRCLNIY